MSASWVAGQVRAVALLNRCLGVAGAREIADAGSLAAAQRLLAAGPYGRHLIVGASAATTEHAIAAETLWRLRVLAGWQPQNGVVAIRALAGAFEVANIETLARALVPAARSDPYRPAREDLESSAPQRLSPSPGFDATSSARLDANTPRYFELGALATGWGRIRDASSPAGLRTALTGTAWGDPGGESLSDIVFGVRVGWSAQIAATVPDLRRWAAGRVAVLVAGYRLLGGGRLPAPVARRVRRVLGPAAGDATDLERLRAVLPASARWALAGVDSAEELWRAEFRGWSRLDSDGRELVRRRRFDASTAIGAAAVLLADGWRTRAAVQIAAAAATPEVFDELVG
ncbi:hypothetical protein [Nocardia seriolae]|uniref:hypothetical protein n=1 Tax=Nocardia seriolae TaxID=37332 RepID=UPI0029542E54|nr:hypothetical protein [Nocardia seriolae]BEK95505.1 hypothetical protein NSER024013_34110 [Nocardia seriolae]